MMGEIRTRLLLRSVGPIVCTAAALVLLAVTLPALGARGPVSSTPGPGLPSLATSGSDGTVERVRQLVPCGGLMYAVGTFTQISQGGTTYDRNNAFAFDAVTGMLSPWDPNVGGSVVNSVALSADCATAYLGGVFKSVGAQAVTNLAAVDTATGALVPGFQHAANGQVNALLTSGSHLLVGGFFTAINGSPRGYLASLNPTSGIDDGYVNLNISGSYQYTDQSGDPAAPNATRVYNFSLNPAKNRLLVMGVFTSVGGLGRRQIFMLSLNAAQATVHPWYSDEFNQNCHYQFPFWLQDASWSPDGTKIFIATTGFKPASGAGWDVAAPRAGLCDAAAAFPATAGLVTHQWVNYTGCDSLYSTATDANTVYVAGHERWMNNPLGCGNNNGGGVVAPGMAGLSPTSGLLNFNPTRGRGLGAVDMVSTPAGLWIASDNDENTNSCGGVSGHAGICFLPYKSKPKADYDGDGRADTAIFRPSSGTWVIPGLADQPMGQDGDLPQAGDFIGDAKSDLAVYRPSTGEWWINGAPTVSYGNSTDTPVAADYTGDEKADLAVWRPSNGTWHVRGVPGAVSYGAATDIPVPADYNGDGKADIAVWRPSNGTWNVRGQPAVAWGQSGDQPVVGDFTGDGKADFAVFRPSTGTWYIKGVATAVWGKAGDVPVAGDFTGDCKADIAVWRPSDGTWYVRGVFSTPAGQAGDIPLAG